MASGSTFKSSRATRLQLGFGFQTQISVKLL
jgi:hypothetical protein